MSYRTDWTLQEVPFRVHGADVAYVCDLECRLVLDADGELVAVELPTKGRGWIAVFPDIHRQFRNKYGNLCHNSPAIWEAAIAAVKDEPTRICDAAGVPTPEQHRPEYTGPEYHPAF